MAVVELDPEEVEDHPSTPSHPAGRVTAFDESSGLPIVRRHAGESHEHGNSREQHVDSTPDHRGEKKEDAGKVGSAETVALHSERKEGAGDGGSKGVAGKQQGAETAGAGGKADDEKEVEPPKDLATGRHVLHQSTDRAELVGQAKAHAKQFEDGLKAATRGVAGAKFDAVRSEKTPSRIDEKINDEGQPIHTIPDILAGRIGVDSPEAHERTVSAIKSHFKVIRDEDEFDKGSPPTNYRVHKLQVQVTPQLSAEAHVVPKEVLEANEKQHDVYDAARDAELDGKDVTAEKKEQQAKAINDAAMDKFNARNSGHSGSTDMRRGGRGESPEQSAAESKDSAKAQSGDKIKGTVGDDNQRGSRFPNRDVRRDARGSDNVSAGAKGNAGGIRVSEDATKPNDADNGSGSKFTKGQTVLVGDSHGVMRGGNPNFASGGRWSVDTPDGSKTLKGSELTPVASPPKPSKGGDYVAVDLDKTLAEQHGKFDGAKDIGKPIPAMVDRVKQMLKNGTDVRIFTARVSEDPKGLARAAIEAWCHRNIGHALPITDKKEPGMKMLFDDRAVQVEPNTGKVVG